MLFKKKQLTETWFEEMERLKKEIEVLQFVSNNINDNHNVIDTMIVARKLRINMTVKGLANETRK